MTRPLSRSQALLLGIVAALAVGIGGWRVMASHGGAWSQGSFLVNVPFRDVAGLTIGTRVHLQGVDVGEVASVQLPEIAGQPVEVQLRLAKHLETRLGTDARVSIARDNPFGDRIVRLVPGDADSPRLRDGVHLEGIETPELFDGLARTAKKLDRVLGQLEETLAQVEAGKGSLGKLVKDEELYNDLAAAARELKAAAHDVRKGEGTIAALVNDRKGYEKALETVEEMKALATSVKQNSDAVKSLPIVRNYVVDTHKELVRPDMTRLRKVYAEDELFEPGRAVLTAAGKERLDGAATWLKGYKTGEVMIASIAAPATNAAFAQTLTQTQADAVRDYLLEQRVQRVGFWWWSNRSVRSLGCGNHAPAQPESESLPASRVEIILFVKE